MNPTPLIREEIPWAKYHDALRREGVPEERLRWYTGWVERFALFTRAGPCWAGGRSARLTVNGAIPESTIYYVEAEVDGIPGYEWRSIDHTWI